MTVIDELPQIKISVRIAGSEVDCTEYDDPDPPRTPASHGVAMHSTSKVIESQNNAEYYIHCEIDNSLGWFEGNSGLGVDVYIDGKYATSELIVQRHLRGQVATKRLEAIEERSEKPGKVLVKSFKFSTITRGMSSLPWASRLYFEAWLNLLAQSKAAWTIWTETSKLRRISEKSKSSCIAWCISDLQGNFRMISCPLQNWERKP